MARWSALPAQLMTLAATLVVSGCKPCDNCQVFPRGDHQPEPRPGKHRIVVERGKEPIVPGPALPEAVAPDLSNNNLDVIRFGGRVYLVLRTSKSHYADKTTRIHVLSSEDELTWKNEREFVTEDDLREPRFLALGDELFLYISELGRLADAFEPRRVLMSPLLADGTWGELKEVMGDRKILWRTAVHEGVGWVTTYDNGGSIYRPITELDDCIPRTLADFFFPMPLPPPDLRIELAKTTDGVHFDTAAVLQDRGGGSETALVFDDDSRRIYTLTRVELPERGYTGSKLCWAPQSDPSRFVCKYDPRKFDSPLLFEQDGEIYLIGRRNLAQEGRYAEGEVRTLEEYALTQQAYACSFKRCSIFRLDKAAAELQFVTDLPSRGDTCFASIIRGRSPDEIVVYDYTQPLNDPYERRWCEAQNQNTVIFRHVVHFLPNDGKPQAGAIPADPD